MAEASESEEIGVVILSLKLSESYEDKLDVDINNTWCQDCDRVNSTEEMMLHLRTWDHYYKAVHSKRFVCKLDTRICLHPDEPLTCLHEARLLPPAIRARMHFFKRYTKFSHSMLGGDLIKDEDTPRSLGIRENDCIRIYSRDAVDESVDLTGWMSAISSLRYTNMMNRKHHKEARKEKNVVAYQTSSTTDHIDIDAIVENINSTGSSGSQEKKKSKPKKSKKKKATGDPQSSEPKPSQAETILPNIQENDIDIDFSVIDSSESSGSQEEKTPRLKVKKKEATENSLDRVDLLMSGPESSQSEPILPILRENEEGNENPDIGSREISASMDSETKILEDRIKELGQEFDDHKNYVAEMIGQQASSLASFMGDIDASEDKIYQNEKETKQVDADIKEYQVLIKKLQLHKLSLEQDSEMHKDLIKKTNRKLGGFERYRVQEHKKAQEKEFNITEEIRRLEDQLSSLRTTDHNHNQGDSCKPNDDKPSDSQRLKEMFESSLRESIRERESSLECPVCFEITDIPIFRCTKEHLICPKCRSMVRDCPVCRDTYRGPPERHRFAEKMVVELKRLREQLAGILG